MSFVLELAEAEAKTLEALAAAEGVSASDYVASWLRGQSLSAPSAPEVPWKTIRTGGWTEAARRLDTTKNNFDLELDELD